MGTSRIEISGENAQGHVDHLKKILIDEKNNQVAEFGNVTIIAEEKRNFPGIEDLASFHLASTALQQLSYESRRHKTEVSGEKSDSEYMQGLRRRSERDRVLVELEDKISSVSHKVALASAVASVNEFRVNRTNVGLASRDYEALFEGERFHELNELYASIFPDEQIDFPYRLPPGASYMREAAITPIFQKLSQLKEGLLSDEFSTEEKREFIRQVGALLSGAYEILSKVEKSEKYKIFAERYYPWKVIANLLVEYASAPNVAQLIIPADRLIEIKHNNGDLIEYTTRSGRKTARLLDLKRLPHNPNGLNDLDYLRQLADPKIVNILEQAGLL